MPALLALLSSLIWGTSDFLGGTATRRIPGPVVVGLSQLVALLALAPIAVLVGGDGTSYVVPGIAAGMVGCVSLAAFYRALATGTMGVVAPIASLGVVVPVVVGLARGEAPGTLQVVGIALAVVGVVLASGPELSGAAGARPLLLSAMSALGFGTALVLVAQGSRGGGIGRVLLVLTVMRMSSVLLLTVLLVLTRSWRLPVSGRDLPVLAAIGLGDVLANAAYGVASQGGLLSVVAVLGSVYPVMTVLLARQLLHERLRPIQLAGVGTALAGVVLLAAG
ncbi:MAG: DMT family transporter [Pseudorhodobacter sp.]|nr:DMT family transporter [Frankiaceae bacterium]